MKPIRFNLVVNGSPARSIEEVRLNFNIDDLVELHQSGVLHRWLEVHGFTKEMEKLRSLPKDADMLVRARRICEAFGVTFDDPKAYSCYAFVLRQRHDEELKKLQEWKKERTRLLEDYHSKYESLVSEILSSGADGSVFQKTRAQVAALWRDFRALVLLDRIRLAHRCLQDAPYAILAILAGGGELRTAALNEPAFAKAVDELRCREVDPGQRLVNLHKSKPFEDAKRLQRDTNKAWVQLVDPGTRILVLATSNHVDDRFGSGGDQSNWKTGATAPGSIFDGLAIHTNVSTSFVQYVPFTEELAALSAPWSSVVQEAKGDTKGHWDTKRERDKSVMVVHLDADCLLCAEANRESSMGPADVNGKFPIIRGGLCFKSTHADQRMLFVDL